MKRDTGFRTVVLIIVMVLCAISLYPTIVIYTKGNDAHLPLEQRKREIFKREHPNVASKAINLGLDLAGGTHIIVEVKKDKLDEEAKRDVMDRSLEILRNRVDQYGLSEPIILKSGDSRIVADLAGMGAEDARRLIGATALLEFKLIPEATEQKPVIDKIDAYLARRGGEKGEAAGTPESDTARAVRDIFGKVVTDSTKAAAPDSAALAAVDSTQTDSAKAADTSAAAQVFKERPFTALLVGLGRDIGVSAENVEKAKRLLDDPEVQKVIPSRYQLAWARDFEILENGAKVRRLYILKRRPEMTGATIADATPNRLSGGMNAGEVEVSLTFKGLGPKEFSKITGAYIGRQLAIVLDSLVYSAPVIQGKIPNGRASITGIGDMEEAKQLSVILRAGSLPAPMEIAELRSVGPTLGEQNIKSGLTAAGVSVILVMLFLLVYYRGSGLIANVALLLNLTVTVSILSAFHATLTLPGIAGLALTIGMSVDANVLIMERIRDELRAGRSIRAAIEAGYARAFRAILDSNITVMGTAAILYWMGVGPIKGFGLTLLIGVGSSMFTAVFVTRLLYDVLINRKDPKTLSIGEAPAWLLNIDLQVMPKMKIYVGISVAAIVISIGSMVFHKGLNLGVDFTGGNVFLVKTESKPDVEAIRAELGSKGGFDPKVQTVGGTGTNEILIHVPKGQNDSVLRTLVQTSVPGGTILQEETVGPTVGNDLKKAAAISIVLSLILIVMYIWFRFGRNGLGYGLGAVISLAHDAIVTMGIFSLMDWQVGLDFVAAILTIIGYSVNDTIVIYDRVRELVNKGGKQTFSSMVSQANNETFSRTIIISLIVLVSVIVLAVFGGSSMRDMNVALIIGVIAGGYSTIALACPFVVWWDRRRLRPNPAGTKAKTINA